MSDPIELARRTSFIIGQVREQLIIPCTVSTQPIVTDEGKAVTVFTVLSERERDDRWTFTALSHEELLQAVDVTVLAQAMIEQFNARFRDGSAGRGVA